MFVRNNLFDADFPDSGGAVAQGFTHDVDTPLQLVGTYAINSEDLGIDNVLGIHGLDAQRVATLIKAAVLAVVNQLPVGPDCPVIGEGNVLPQTDGQVAVNHLYVL